MAKNEKDLYMSWLNDAYAMEKNVEQMLQSQVDQVKDYPNLQNRIQEHLQVTRNQADMVKQCIQRNGGNVSSIKTGLAELMGNLSGPSTGMAQDSVIKDTLSDFAVENFEIGAYMSLIDAANRIGDAQTASICSQILQQEQNMAQWLHQNIPTVSEMELNKVAAS